MLDVEAVSKVLFVSMHDLSKARVDSNGDLIYRGHKISVIYSRYDFSHPSGQYDSNPTDDAPASPIVWQSEWETIEKIECSRAILSSNIGCRLAVRRRTHFELSRPGVLESLGLTTREIELIKTVLPDQWSLDPLEDKTGDSIHQARSYQSHSAPDTMIPLFLP